KGRGLTGRSWLEWEAGAAPNRDYQDLVSRLFSTNAVRLGFCNDYQPTTSSTTDSDVFHPSLTPGVITGASRNRSAVLIERLTTTTEVVSMSPTALSTQDQRKVILVAT